MRSPWWPILTTVALVGWSVALEPANAQCSPTALMAKDVQTIQVSIPIEIAFVLAATKDEFDQAKKGLGGTGQSGIILTSADFNEARASAQKVASAIKFERDRSDYQTFLTQQLIGDAHRTHVRCLTIDNKPPSGLLVWFDQRASDIYILNGMWFGGVQGSVANTEGAPYVSDGKLEKKPEKWTNGKVEQLIWKKPPNTTALLNMSVGGQTTTFRVVGDAPFVRWGIKEVRGPKLSASSYHVSGTVCGGGSAEGCVIPQNPGGSLIRGTGRMTDFSASETSRAGFAVSSETPDRICVKLTVSTGACEARNNGQGVVTAVEQYPDVQTETQR
jgi:hypothetical protein